MSVSKTHSAKKTPQRSGHAGALGSTPKPKTNARKQAAAEQPPNSPPAQTAEQEDLATMDHQETSTSPSPQTPQASPKLATTEPQGNERSNPGLSPASTGSPLSILSSTPSPFPDMKAPDGSLGTTA